MSNIKNIVEKFSELSVCSSIFVGSKIPNKKLNNARNKYAQDARDVYLLIDCTVFGSAKEGMLVAENGVYARNTLSNPVFLKYDQITSIELDESKEKLLINGEKYLFFVGIDEYCKNLIVEMLLEVAQIELVNDQQIDNRNNEISDESFCVSCGAVLSLNSKFCNECGVKQELNCNDCGVALAQGSKFCSECGSPVGVDSKDDQKADAKLEPKLKPEPENSKQSSVDEMSLMGVIEKIKKEYSDHEDLDEIVSDLEGDNFIDHWAGRFAQERFPANFEISKMLYQVHLKNAESFSDYNDAAESIADKDGINDQEYARELFKKAESLVEEADDIVSIAESVSNEDGLGDKKWAEVLYKKASEMSDDFDLIIGVGDSVLSSLNNKKWAEEIYRKAENNLGSLNEYNRLICSLRDNLENTEWSNSIVSKAADALLSADDTFEFAGYPSEIIDLGRSVADENELNDKERAKKIFTLIQGYQGVTDNLDAARAVIEIYDDGYIKEYVSKALEVGIANLESGYYCDIYNFIAAELEDIERAEEYKSNYLEEMREDNVEYGGCEELFEDEDDLNSSAISDELTPTIHVVESYDYDALSGKKGKEEINSIRDIVSALISSYKHSIRDTGNEQYYLETSNGLVKINDPDQEYDVGNADYFSEKESIRVYFTGKTPVSWVDGEFMNMSSIFGDNLSSLGEYDDSPRMMAYMKEDEDWVVQGYENGEYDTGYHSEGPEDDYFIQNREGLADMLANIIELENKQDDTDIIGGSVQNSNEEISSISFVKKIEIFGRGQEFIIGTVGPNDVNSLVSSGDIDSAFEDVEGLDDVVHVYGVEADHSKILDENENELNLNQFVINYEPCYETVDKEDLLEQVNDELQKCADGSQVVDQIFSTGKFKKKPESSTFLIQSREMKGHWATIEFDSTVNSDQITLVTVEMEGMEHIAPNIVVGLLVNGENGCKFVEIDYDGTTWGVSNNFYAFDLNEGFVWESSASVNEGAKGDQKDSGDPESSNNQPSSGELTLQEVIEKIKKECSDHEDIDEIISDLEGDNFIDHWAGRFAQERFPANFEISKMLYQVHLKNAESFSDYNDTAESIADKDGINDQEYARELFKKAESLVEDLYDLRGLATAVGAANGLGDKEWSKELFKKAETQCEEADDVVSIAESVSNKDGLDDKKWAEVLYKKALEMSDDFDLIIGVGDSVLSSLNNKKWAEEIYRKAENNLGSLNEYNRLIYSLRDNLENTEWSNSIVSKAADALLSADDTFEFAGYPSEIIDLGRSVADENELNNKDRAKKIFTLIQGYQGVTDNLDAARAVIEIYDGDYIEEYLSKALEVAIANLESGYYCDIYNFIASELEDTERADEYKSNYLEEMREDNDEYGGCEELFEGEGEDEYNESFQGDGRGQSDMPDARAPIVHVVASYDYDALSDKEGDDKINSIRDIVSALIASYKKSIRDTGGERYYIQTSNGLTKVDNSSQEYDVGDSNYFDEKEAIRVYISGDELVSWLDSEFMNMSAVFAENLSSLGDYDDSPRMYAYMKEDEDWVVQGYENGEYDTGYHSEGPEDDYFVKNIEGLEDMLPSIAWLENDQVDK